MQKVPHSETGAPPPEHLGNVEIRPLLQQFRTSFVDYTNNIILGALRTIERTATTPRVGRLPKEDLDWKHWIGEFSGLRMDYIVKMTTLKTRYREAPSHPDFDEMAGVLEILRSFDSNILKNPEMEIVIKAIEELMRRFQQ